MLELENKHILTFIVKFVSEIINWINYVMINDFETLVKETCLQKWLHNASVIFEL